MNEKELDNRKVFWVGGKKCVEGKGILNRENDVSALPAA